MLCFSLVEPVKLILDCQMINEDTLVGLELQQLTPFRFHFRKLWINNYFRHILSPHTTSDINLILNLTNVDVSFPLLSLLSIDIFFFNRISRIYI